MTLFYRLTGEGSPTVIMDSGLGDTSEVWSAVEPKVAEFARVLVYDRANLGRSERSAAPRTSSHMVAELKELLQAEHIEGPYLLVGHSFGGLNMMLFARLYPADIMGLVLVDSSHPEQVERLLSALPPDLRLLFKQSAGENDEMITFEERMRCEEEMKAAPPMPDLPLVVLSRGLAPARSAKWPSERLEELWQEQQQELLEMVPQSKLLVAERSGHYIQRDQPELVIEAIREIINRRIQ